MDNPFITYPSGVFNFLGLPSELRNRIYQLHLSKGGDVNYHTWIHEWLRVPHAIAVNRPFVGVNLLRVCRQIYLEAVKYAYTDRKWNFDDDYGFVRMLRQIPGGTVEKIQQLKLSVAIDLQAPTLLPRSFTNGALSKLKSLQCLDLEVTADIPEDGATHFDSPVLVDLVCHILSHIPVQAEIFWSSPLREDVVSEWISRGCNSEIEGELDAALKHIERKFASIKGRHHATTT